MTGNKGFLILQLLFNPIPGGGGNATYVPYGDVPPIRHNDPHANIYFV